VADVGTLAVWALVTGGTPLVLAAVPVLRTRLSDRTTHVMLGVSAGILLGLSFLHILPESFEVSESLGLPSQAVPLGVAAGFFVLMLIERQAFHRGHPAGTDHRDERDRAHEADGHVIHPFGTLALSALTIHGLVDGFVIPLGFEIGGATGTVIVLAVALHQIPDSFAALAVGLASTRSRRAATGFVVATAIDTPLGIGLGIGFLGAGASWLAVGLAFSAGTFLFVSAADLIPELQHRSRSLLVSLAIVLGFAGVGLLAFLPT
jgi:zinc transporter ZupT